MGWSYGDWSRILVHDLSSSNLCSEETLGAFHYKFRTILALDYYLFLRRVFRLRIFDEFS